MIQEERHGGAATSRLAALSDVPPRRGTLRFAALLVVRHPGHLVAALSLPLLAAGGTLATPLLMGRLSDAVLAGDRVGVVGLGVAVIGAAIVTIVVHALADSVLARLGESVLRDLRDRVFHTLLRAPLRFLDRHRAGELLHRATSEIAALSSFVRDTVPILVGALCTLVVAGAALATQSLFLLGVLVLVLVPGATLIAVQFGRRAPAAEAAEAAAMADVADALSEFVRVRSVWQQAPPALTAARLRAEARRNARSSDAELQSVHAGMWVEGLSVVEGACLAVLVLVGAHLVETRTVSVGVVVTFVLASRSLLSAIDQMTALAGLTVEAVTGLARVRDLLACAAADSCPAGETAAPAETRPAPEVIEVERVAFGYGGTPVLRDVTLRVEPGERVCLVGRTGAGKSTLAKVIAGLYPPDAGAVRYGGRDLQSMSAEERPARIAYVPQEVPLVGVVRDALLLAGEKTEDALHASAAGVGLGDWLGRLPDGLDTPVRGLSAGECQLVGLVRVAVLDAPVLVLDEITSDLDPHTARLVEAALHQISEGRTLILIAHRPETVAGFTRGATGRVVEVGAGSADRARRSPSA